MYSYHNNLYSLCSVMNIMGMNEWIASEQKKHFPRPECSGCMTNQNDRSAFRIQSKRTDPFQASDPKSSWIWRKIWNKRLELGRNVPTTICIRQWRVLAGKFELRHVKWIEKGLEVKGQTSWIRGLSLHYSFIRLVFHPLSPFTMDFPSQIVKKNWYWIQFTSWWSQKHVLF